jgi:nucleotide-binding universal stress UspA family protein
MLPTINTLLYASDISEGSRPAFRMAVEQAVRHQANIVFLHAVEPFNGAAIELLEAHLPHDTQNLHDRDWLNGHKARITARIQSFLDTELSAGEALAQPPQIRVLIGPPAKTIIRSADKLSADLIVMGERSTSTASRLFFGSTARKVLHHTRIHVLIVPLGASKNND